MKNFKINLDYLYTLLLLLNLISLIGLFKILNFLSTNNYNYNIKTMLISHLIYIMIGWGILYIISRMKPHHLKLLIMIGVVIGFISLILVLIIGPVINGTRRWLNILNMGVQPTSFFLSIFPYINGTLLNKKKFFKSTMMTLTTILLFLLEPDFGSTILLIGIWIIQFFMINKLDYIKKFLPFIGISLPIMLIIKGGYIIRRIKFILNPSDEINQVNLAIKAIRFSKFWGTNNAIYIPEMHNDYFFSSFINLFGRIPGILFLLFWMYFIQYLLNKLECIDDSKDKNIVMGSIVFLMGQSILHIFTNLNLIPPKGISFPLISAGGSLLIANMIGIGIMINILKNINGVNNNKNITKDDLI